MTKLLENFSVRGGFIEFHQITVDPSSIGAGSTGDTDVTVSGLETANDEVMAVVPPAGLEDGLVLNGASIPSDDTVRITLLNRTGSSVDGASKSWNVMVYRTD